MIFGKIQTCFDHPYTKPILLTQQELDKIQAGDIRFCFSCYDFSYQESCELCNSDENFFYLTKKDYELYEEYICELGVVIFKENDDWYFYDCIRYNDEYQLGVLLRQGMDKKFYQFKTSGQVLKKSNFKPIELIYTKIIEIKKMDKYKVIDDIGDFFEIRRNVRLKYNELKNEQQRTA
jgi:hypothetical protein